MKLTSIASAIGLVILTTMPASAQSSYGRENGTPLNEIAAAVARKTGKKLVLDPRSQETRIPTSTDASKLAYDDFLDLLQVNGLVAVDQGNVTFVVSDAGVRTMPVPLVTGNEKHPASEVVTRVIHVRNVPAAQLVPILRPLVPQFGHLAAAVCSNDLLLVDRFANTKRLESIVQALDTGQPYKPEKCPDTVRMPPPAAPAAPAARD